jgi:hypothetical protein
MSFADLDPPQAVERRARPRVRWSGHPREATSVEEAPPPTTAGRVLDAARRSLAGLRPLRERAGRASAAAWRNARPALSAGREAVSHVVRVGVARFVAGLPAERPDRRTIVAVVTSLVVLTGLSAGVVASRDGGGSRGLPVVTAASILPLPALPAPRPAAAPSTAPAREPEPAVPAAPSTASVSVSGAAPASPTAPARVAKHPQPVHKHAAASRTLASAHAVPAKPAPGKAVAAKPAVATAASGPPAAKPAATAAPAKPAATAAFGKPAASAAPTKMAAKPAPAKSPPAIKPMFAR